MVYVTADMAGELDSPLYGMFDIHEQLKTFNTPDGYVLEQNFIDQPLNPYRYSIKWDGRMASHL